MRSRERQVDVAAFADRLAAVEALEHGELPRALLDDPCDPEEVLGALGGRERRPAVVERGAGGLHGEVDVMLVRLGDLGERLLGRRRAGGKPLARLRVDELATDEQPVALLELDDVACLGGRRVLPLRQRGNRRVALTLELSHGVNPT